jgi:hypothetical protein
MDQPEIGRLENRHGRIHWILEPDEARELAEVLGEALDDPRDLGWRDVRALQAAADELDPPDASTY